MAAIVALLAITLPTVDLVKLTGAKAETTTTTATVVPTSGAPTATTTGSPTLSSSPTDVTPTTTVTVSPTGPTLAPTRPSAAPQGSTTANGVTVEVTANPTTIYGPTSVTFTYRITNDGFGDLFIAANGASPAQLGDTACSPLDYVSGVSVRTNGHQANRGRYIAAGSTGIWTCSATISGSTTSTFSVSGLIRSGQTVPPLSATETVTQIAINPTCSQVWYSTVGTAAGLGELGTAVDATYQGRIATLQGLGSAALAITPDGKTAYYTRRASSELRALGLVTGTDVVVGSVSAAWDTNRLAVSPTGVLWSYTSAGNLYSWPIGSSAMPVNHGVVSVPAGGTITSGAGDIAFDGLGNLWIVAGEASTTLYTVSAAELTKTSGVQSIVVGQLTGATGYFNGLAFAADGTLYGSTPGNLYTVPLNATGAVTRVSALSADVADLASCAAPKPIMSIAKSVSVAAAAPGVTVTYTVTVANQGALPASGVSVQDVLPAGVTYVAGSTKLNGIVVPDGGAGAFPYATSAPVNASASNAGVIPAGSQAVLTFEAVVGPPNTRQVCNAAQLTFSGGGATPLSSEVCFTVNSASLTVAKTAIGTVQGPSSAGNYTVSYQVVVTNTGTADGTYGLVDTPQFDPGTTVTGVSWTGASTGSATAAAAPYALAAPGTVIPTGATHRYDVTVTFTRSSSAGESVCAANTPEAGLFNAATLTPGQGAETTASACLTAPKPLAMLDLVKQPGTLITNPDGTYTATYTLAVTNSGNGDGTYGPISDTPSFDSDVTIVSASWTGPGTTAQVAATSVPSFAVGTATAIKPGESHSYTVSIVFRHTGPGAVEPCVSANGAGLTNVANLQAGQEQANSTGNNAACLEPVARFAVRKSAESEPVTATYDAATGHTASATYTVTIVNTGLAAAPVPAVTDTPTLPDGFSVTSVTVNGDAVSHVLGAFSVPAGTTALAPRAEVTYEVVLTMTAAVSAERPIDWSKATCSAEGTVPGGGVVNSIALGDDSDGPDNNVACVSIVPPTTVVTVRNYAMNCGTQQSTCDLTGATFEIFDGDPLSGGKSVAIITSSTGAALVVGQTYWIVQTQAPLGFQLLGQPASFTVLPTTLTVPEGGLVTTSTGHRLDVLNVAKSELPKAGGSGPMGYALMGSALFAAALALSQGGRLQMRRGGSVKQS